jgi:hypothetical protein
MEKIVQFSYAFGRSPDKQNMKAEQPDVAMIEANVITNKRSFYKITG